MFRSRLLFRIQQPLNRNMAWGDAVVLLGIAGFLYVGIRLAFNSPEVIKGPVISLSPAALPWYTCLSLIRMTTAYFLSLGFTLIYGSLAANNKRAEQVMMPLLDVLQSIPLLSFLPVVLLSFNSVLPSAIAAEVASVVLIMTSQAWNLTFSWYQSLRTIPTELKEASDTFRFNHWLRFKTLELPFAAIGLIWNSMMSWAGGWFFLMAAEMFTVGRRDFRLPGLGTYLHDAASQGNVTSLVWGIATLVTVVVLLDQVIWRPMLAWAERFKLEMVSQNPSVESWFYSILDSARLVRWFSRALWRPAIETLDAWSIRRWPGGGGSFGTPVDSPWAWFFSGTMVGLGISYGIYKTGLMLLSVPLSEWGSISRGLLATLLRVFAALLLALLWTIPTGVAIGTNTRLAARIGPIVQVAASVPATALFPVLVLLLVNVRGGLNIAAVVLMLMGTQWYLLFNIIAGASSIPQDLKYVTALLHLSRWERWRRLIFPSLFPYLITGAVTAGGGAWNASIVAEYVRFGEKTLQTTGIGSMIAQATAAGDYPLLLASTLTMIVTVVLLNNLVWRRLYRVAEERYRME
jgi:NitT/TauT family transport system permease protein